MLGHHARLMADDGHQVRIVAGRGEQIDPRIPVVQIPLADSRHPDVLSIKTELDAGRVPDQFAELIIGNRLKGVRTFTRDPLWRAQKKPVSASQECCTSCFAMVSAR